MLAVLVACGPSGTGVVDDEPAVTTDRTTPVALVVLQRSGGIAGGNDRVSVSALGVATIVSSRSDAPSTRTLSSANLATLRQALERSEMATLQRNYLDRQARDAYQYDIVYKGITVTADERVVPAKLRPVVDQLTKLIVE